MLNIGLDKILLILLVALVVVGPRRLPEISRKLGHGLRELQRISGSAQEQIRSVLPIDEIRSALPIDELRGTLTTPPGGGGNGQAGPSTALGDLPPPVDPGPPAPSKSATPSGQATPADPGTAATPPATPAPPPVAPPLDLGPPT